MHPLISFALSRERVSALRAAAAERRGEGDGGAAAVVIRRARAADTDALAHLAALESRRAPAGAALVAEEDGAVRAALPLDGSPALADPFRPTAALVALLRLRAAQLDGAGRSGARRGVRRAGRRVRLAHGPGAPRVAA